MSVGGVRGQPAPQKWNEADGRKYQNSIKELTSHANAIKRADNLRFYNFEVDKIEDSLDKIRKLAKKLQGNVEETVKVFIAQASSSLEEPINYNAHAEIYQRLAREVKSYLDRFK